MPNILHYAFAYILLDSTQSVHVQEGALRSQYELSRKPNGSSHKHIIHRGEPNESAAPGGNATDIHTAAAHQIKSAESDAVAAMLLAMFTFQLSLFYMVNHPNKSVQAFTWEMLSAAVSIFAAILVWTAIIGLAMFLFTGDAHAEPALLSLARRLHGHGNEHEGLALGPLLCVYGTVLCLYHGTLLFSRLWLYEMPLEAFATLGAHTTGFATVQVLGTLAENKPWNSSWVFMACLSLMSLVALLALNVLTNSIRRTMVSPRQVDQRIGPRHKFLRWEHVYKEADNEFVAFSLGLMLTLTIQFLVTGEEVPYHGNPYGKSTAEVGYMFLASLALAVIMILFITYDAQIQRLFNEDLWETFIERAPTLFRLGLSVIERAVTLTSDCIAFGFGWCFLFSSRCLYWCSTNDHGLVNGSQMTARVIQALGLTLVTILVILMLKALTLKYVLGDKPVKALMTGFGLMLGLSWEGAFFNAIEDITEETKPNPTRHLMLSCVLGLGLCVAVLPAWYLYVFPRALEMKHFKKNSEQKPDSPIVVEHGLRMEDHA